MKKLKSVLTLVLIAVMALALLAGCGGPQIPTDPNPGGNAGGGNAGGGNAGGGNAGGGNAGGGDTPAVTQTVHELYAAGTTLRMGTGYNNANTGIAFDAGTAGDGIQLANGKTYLSGDLKPTWEKLEEILNVKFEDKYQGNSASN